MVLALLVYQHGFFIMQLSACRYIASELLPVNQWQQDRLAARDTAATRHLLQHPAVRQLAPLSPRDVTLLTCVYQFLQGNGAVEVSHSISISISSFFLLLL